ncbi:MAG: hypothetical protein NVS4B12_22410 [Ktedonobacteraceae bacterium]
MALCLCVLAACSSGDPPTSASGSTPTPKVTTGSSATTVAVTSLPSTPGVGPIVILSPTPIPGGGAHSQQVVLADRTLLINNVSKGVGADANSVAINMAMTLKNTSAKAISNQSSYFSLFGSEGDVFGLPANTTGSFFGPINANGSRSGTVVFQVPTSAAKTLRLFYRSEVVSEAVFVPFNV